MEQEAPEPVEETEEQDAGTIADIMLVVIQ